MNAKFKNATKKIAAVATSAVMMSSAVFSAGLNNYPDNFVSNGKFDAKVVVGAAANANDNTAANMIIDALKSDFSGDSKKVKITYKKSSSSSGGETINAIKTTNQLNYGEDIGTTSETTGFDDGDSDLLQDEDFDNGLSDEEYEQTLKLSNGAFNYALRDEVDGIDEIMDGVFYNNDETFATYTLDLKNAINLSTSSDLSDDFIGKSLTIMGNDFTIGTITQSSGELSKLELIGGSNKATLEEGQSTTLNIDGVSYEVKVISVDASEAIIEVNGQTETIDEYDTEDIAGISVAVTNVHDPSRSTSTGYATIVVGGQKVTLEDAGKLVKVNDEDVDDLFEGYEVYSDFSDGGTMDTITITYKVSEDTLLQEGDSLTDVLFGSFSLIYQGTNEPDYETLELRVNDDDISVDGTVITGKSFNRDFVHTTSTNGTNGVTYLKGDQDGDRIFFSGSAYMGIDADDNTNGIQALNSTGGTTISVGTALTSLNLNFSNTGLDGSGFNLFIDADEMYLYELDSIDTNDAEVDVREFVDDKAREELTGTKFLSDLEKTLATSTYTAGTTTVKLNVADLGSAKLAFANELMMDFSNIEGVSPTATSGYFTFTLDSDVDGDDAATDEDEAYNVTLGWDTSDSEFNLVVSSSDTDFVNRNDADTVDGSTDVKEYVTSYGTKVRYDNDENTYVKIMVPEEQVYAKVDLVFGKVSSSSEMTITVDEDMVDDKIEELKDDGFTIVDQEEVESSDVTIDITAPVTDAQVSGTEDLIVVGGPAVNKIAAELLGKTFPTYGSASGVSEGEAVVKYFEDVNSVLVYGYEKEDTLAAAKKLVAGGLSGNEQRIQ